MRGGSHQLVEQKVLLLLKSTADKLDRVPRNIAPEVIFKGEADKA